MLERSEKKVRPAFQLSFSDILHKPLPTTLHIGKEDLAQRQAASMPDAWPEGLPASTLLARAQMSAEDNLEGRLEVLWISTGQVQRRGS